MESPRARGRNAGAGGISTGADRGCVSTTDSGMSSTRTGGVREGNLLSSLTGCLVNRNIAVTILAAQRRCDGPAFRRPTGSRPR